MYPRRIIAPSHFRHDDGAASSYLIAGMLAAVLVGGSVFVSIDRTDDITGAAPLVDEGALALDAESILSLLLTSQSLGWKTNGDWDEAAGTQLAGLRNSTGGLDTAKLTSLRGGSLDSTASNRLLDYPEMVAALGLGQSNVAGATATAFVGGADVRITIEPLSPLNSLLNLSTIRTAYIGDWLSLGSFDVTLDTNEAMEANARSQIDAVMAANAVQERAALEALGLDFNDAVYIGPGSPAINVDPLSIPLLTQLGVGLLEGDIYPDIKAYLDAVLPGRIGLYDVLVIGYDVAQNSMTAAGTKQAIQDWVEAGGVIIVLGSSNTNYQWLQPLFHSGATAITSTPTAPNPTHTILSYPHELNWDSYDEHDVGWDITGDEDTAPYADFEHIVSEGDADALAASKPGRFGTGFVILTSFRAGEIADQTGLTEAMNFIHNMLFYAYMGNVQLTYGPEPPTDAAVAAATRHEYLYARDGTLVPVRLTLLVWRS